VADESVDISIRARLEEFERELRRVPGITEKEIRAAVKGMEKAWRMPDPGKAAKEWDKKLRDLRQGAGAVFGGIVNDVDDIAGALGALGGPTAAVVAGIGGLALVGGAAATGIYKIVDAGDEAFDRLGKLQGVVLDPVPDEVRNGIEDANAALESLGVLSDLATVALGGNLAPAVERVAAVTLELGLRGLDMFQAWSEGHSVLEEVAVWMGSTMVQMVLAPFTVMASGIELLGDLGEVLGIQDNALKKLGDRYDAWTDSVARSVVESAESSDALQFNTTRADAMILSYRAMEVSTELATTAKREHAKHSREVAEALRREREEAERLKRVWDANIEANETLADIHGRVADDITSEADKIRAARAEAIAQVEEQISKAKEAGVSEAELAEIVEYAERVKTAARERATRDLEDLAERQRQAVEFSFEGPSVETGEAIVAATEEFAERVRNAWLDSIGDIVGAYGDMFGLVQDQHEHELEMVREQRRAARDSAEGITAAQRKRFNDEAAMHKASILAAFNAQKAASFAQAGIRTAGAVLNVMDTIPAPAWPVAIPATIAMGAVQAGLILSEPPPRLHKGFTPSEREVVMDKQEGVANRRAMNTPGFREALSDANAGRSIGGETTFVFAMNDTVVDTYTARAMRVGRRTRLQVKRLARSRHRGGYG
jgi:hypothetical protein